MSVLNACSTVKIHTSNATFNKQFAQLILAVAAAYAIPISGFARTEMVNQQNTGIWRGGPWQAGIASFLGTTDMGNTPYGFAYSTTLDERGENAYDPYGDQRYSKTLNTDMTKVKVAG
jgi:hypothetical protein